MYLINLSGHPVDAADYEPLVGVNIDPTSTPDMIGDITDAILGCPEIEAIRRGKAVEVILPGMSCAAGIALAVFHGIAGSFPMIRWAIRGADGFEWPNEATCHLNEVRLASRTARL